MSALQAAEASAFGLRQLGRRFPELNPFALATIRWFASHSDALCFLCGSILLLSHLLNYPRDLRNRTAPPPTPKG